MASRCCFLFDFIINFRARDDQELKEEASIIMRFVGNCHAAAVAPEKGEELIKQHKKNLLIRDFQVSFSFRFGE